MSTTPTVPTFRAWLREAQSPELDMVLAEALEAAKAQANQFAGFDIATDPTSDSAIAIYLLAQNLADQGTPAEVEMRRARAESLLRPYRKDTGVAA